MDTLVCCVPAARCFAAAAKELPGFKFFGEGSERMVSLCLLASALLAMVRHLQLQYVAGKVFIDRQAAEPIVNISSVDLNRLAGLLAGRK